MLVLPVSPAAACPLPFFVPHLVRGAVLANVAEKSGLVLRAAYEAAMDYIRDNYAPADWARHATTAEQRQLNVLKSKFFDTFGPNEDDAVDFVELCTGFSVLCGGSRDQKVADALRLFGALCGHARPPPPPLTPSLSVPPPYCLGT
jgi:hypothetical protein